MKAKKKKLWKRRRNQKSQNYTVFIFCTDAHMSIPPVLREYLNVSWNLHHGINCTRRNLVYCVLPLAIKKPLARRISENSPLWTLMFLLCTIIRYYFLLNMSRFGKKKVIISFKETITF